MLAKRKTHSIRGSSNKKNVPANNDHSSRNVGVSRSNCVDGVRRKSSFRQLSCHFCQSRKWTATATVGTTWSYNCTTIKPAILHRNAELVVAPHKLADINELHIRIKWYQKCGENHKFARIWTQFGKITHFLKGINENIFRYRFIDNEQPRIFSRAFGMEGVLSLGNHLPMAGWTNSTISKIIDQFNCRPIVWRTNDPRRQIVLQKGNI